MSRLDSARARLRQLFFGAEKPAEPQPPVGQASEAEFASPDVGMAPEPADTGSMPRHLFYTSSDGLRLHVAEYGKVVSPWLPVVCIPGLSRSARDFDRLARHLSSHPERPRRVLAFELRGRGMSDWDKDITHYTPLVEMQDVLDGMTALDVDRAVIVGTSRGGLIAMLMAVARPRVIAGVVLNDVGPVLEPRGLARLKTYIGRTPAPDDWDDAVRILRRLHGHQFTELDDNAWLQFARMTWHDDNGFPAGDYDPALARTFDGVEFDRPLPTLWREFAAMAGSPVITIRGENSDILSGETLARMGREHPRFDQVVVKGQGHAPLLIDDMILRRIASFIGAAEAEAVPAGAVVSSETPGSGPGRPGPV